MNEKTADIFSFALGDITTAFIAFLPQLFWALIILIIGILLGRLGKSLVKSALHAINLNGLVKNAGFGKLSSQADFRPQVEEGLGELTRWLIIYLFTISFLNILGLTNIADFLTNILSYLPNIIAALLIFIIAVLLAGFTESFVKNAVASFDVITARLMGKIASYTIVVIGALIALSELGIAEFFINILFIGFVVTLSLTLGLAIGLGSKDVINDILKNWYKKYNQQTKKK